MPQRYYVGHSSDVSLYTSNPLVIDAWSQREIDTGDSAFDSVIAELPASRRLNNSDIDLANGWHVFSLHVGGTFNEALLDTRLRPTSSRIEEPSHGYKDDGVWAWQSGASGTGSETDVAVIDFSFGWGDCFVACFGMHHLRAIVGPEADAEVYDMGGDTLPDGLRLSPNTRPWPP